MNDTNCLKNVWTYCYQIKVNVLLIIQMTNAIVKCEHTGAAGKTCFALELIEQVQVCAA